MKKTYINPSAEVMKIDAGSTILTGSIAMDDTYEVDTTVEDMQLGREDHIFHPNLWDKKW